MTRLLAIIATSGILISAAALSAAGIIAKRQGMPLAFTINHNSRQTEPFIESGEITSRDLLWTDSSILDVDIPGTVHFSHGPIWRVTAKGSTTTLDHLRLENGHLYLDAPGLGPGQLTLEVWITGPILTAVSLNGSGLIVLEGLAQEALDINLQGSGAVTASGTVSRLALTIMGSGKAQLADLHTRDMNVKIFGSGDGEVTATGNLNVSIFGSGDLRLRTHPEHISSHLFGPGRIIEPSAAAKSLSTEPTGPL